MIDLTQNLKRDNVLKDTMTQGLVTVPRIQEEKVTVKIPPIKTQGIKTKLVRFIADNIKWNGNGKWIEPFFGSGVVLFNISPKKALATESNIHIVNLYKSIQSNEITAQIVRSFLEQEGKKLEKNGESYYYDVRDRFNECHNSLDFLFLNRACFNGLMRFNSKGRYNVPFCRKPERFSKSYITKITNQVAWLGSLLKDKKNWRFEAMDWRESVKKVEKDDFLYLDPPYYGRNTNYYDVWSEVDLHDLAGFLKQTKCKFALSLWLENKYRKNDDIERYFSEFKIKTHEHFYHVGSTESLRNSMTEALIMRS